MILSWKVKPQHEPQVKNGEQKSHPLLLFFDLSFLLLLSSEQVLSSQHETEELVAFFNSFIEIDEQQGLIDKPNTINVKNIEISFTYAKIVYFLIFSCYLWVRVTLIEQKLIY